MKNIIITANSMWATKSERVHDIVLEQYYKTWDGLRLLVLHFLFLNSCMQTVFDEQAK